jgi:hypothetical protein
MEDLRKQEVKYWKEMSKRRRGKGSTWELRNDGIHI